MNSEVAVLDHGYVRYIEHGVLSRLFPRTLALFDADTKLPPVDAQAAGATTGANAGEGVEKQATGGSS